MSLEDLNKKFLKRWNTIKKRSTDYGLKIPEKNDVYELVKKSFFSGFKCEYCGVQLKIYDTKPYYNVFSIEHKKPLLFGGDNSIENLAIVCHKCNVVKGPMTEDTWKKIILHLPKKIFDQMCNEVFAAKMAYLLETQRLQRKINDARKQTF